MLGESIIGPIRTALREVAREEIRRRNAVEHGGEEYWEEDVESVLEKIHSLRHSDTIDTGLLERWATHPDERIRVALLECDYVGLVHWRTIGRKLAGLILDIDRSTRSDGEAWNPVLDRLASRSYRWHDTRGLLESRGDAEGSDGPEIDEWLQSRVVPVLRERGLSSEEARRLLEFTRCGKLVSVVISLVKPDAAFVTWLGEHEPAELPTLAAREDLGPDVERKLWDTVLSACPDPKSNVPAAKIFAELRKRNALPDSAFEDLVPLAEQASWDAARVIVPFLYQIIGAARFERRLASEQLRRLYHVPFVRQIAYRVNGIVLHPAADEELCAHIARDTKSEDVREKIAERFGWSPIVRDAFRESTAHKILPHLAQHAAGDELVDILDRLARSCPNMAIDILRVRAQNGKVKPELYRETLARYFERLISFSARLALEYAETVRKELREENLRPEWVRSIVRVLSNTNASLFHSLNAFEEKYLQALEAEDWIAALNFPRGQEKVAEVLFKIPSATAHPEARRFIFQHGEWEAVIGLLAKGGPRPEELRSAARAVLRVAYYDFDEVLARWPELKSALDANDLIPLLQSDSAFVRQKAILLLGELGRSAPGKRPAPEAPERALPLRDQAR